MTPAALAVGSLIGGLLYGRRTWPGTPTRQLRTLGCGFAVGSLPTLADPAPALAITVAVLPGLFLAPLPVTAFHTLDFLGPRLLSLRRRPGSSPLWAWDRPVGSHSRGSCQRPLLPRQPQVLPPAGPQPGPSCCRHFTPAADRPPVAATQPSRRPDHERSKSASRTRVGADYGEHGSRVHPNVR